MEYKTLGRTGLRVSSLALGTVELGIDYGIQAPGHFGQPDAADAIRLVHAALDAGINYIDTARAYGGSEAVLGKALDNRRDQVVLATKAFTQDPDGRGVEGDALRRQLRAQLDVSLQQLQTDYIDLWQIHTLDAGTLAQIEVVAEVFAAARQAGKVRWAGASSYGSENPRRALETGIFDVLQVPYSVFDQRLADYVIPAAGQQEVGIVVRSILLKGALTAKADYLPDELETLKARSRRYRELVAASGLDLSPAQAAIAFGLAHPQINTILVGVRTEQELAENMKATQCSLGDDFLAALRDLRLDDDDLLHPGTWEGVL